MNTRIRYVKGAEGLVSLQTFRGTSFEYKSVINADGKSGKIIDAVTGGVVAEVAGTSGHKVRIKLKKELIKLGVTFDVESRKTTEG